MNQTKSVGQFQNPLGLFRLTWILSIASTTKSQYHFKNYAKKSFDEILEFYVKI